MNELTLSLKSELVRHEAAIQALAVEVFGNRMASDVWQWAYLDNPHGDPWVSLCYDGDRLVGHYAMVPLPVSQGARRLRTYLSMTTMVAATHRQHGLFVKLAGATYSAASAAGADCVMGFPNSQSTPGFQKRLEWQIPPSDFVAKLEKPQLLEIAPRLLEQFRAGWRLDLRNEATRRWRLARPGGDYVWADGLAYKVFGDTIDVLAFDSLESLSALPDGMPIHVLLGSDDEALRPMLAFDYQFGGHGLASDFDSASFARQMILSDVF